MVSERSKVIAHLNTYLGMQIRDVSDSRIAEMARLVVTPDEKWKENNVTGVRPKGGEDSTQPAMKLLLQYLDEIS